MTSRMPGKLPGEEASAEVLEEALALEEGMLMLPPRQASTPPSATRRNPRTSITALPPRQANTSSSASKANHGSWTAEEHERFLYGMERFPTGPWRQIASAVGTRTARQAMAHAQKYRQYTHRRRKNQGLQPRIERTEYAAEIGKTDPFYQATQTSFDSSVDAGSSANATQDTSMEDLLGQTMDSVFYELGVDESAANLEHDVWAQGLEDLELDPSSETMGGFEIAPIAEIGVTPTYSLAKRFGLVTFKLLDTLHICCTKRFAVFRGVVKHMKMVLASGTNHARVADELELVDMLDVIKAFINAPFGANQSKPSSFGLPQTEPSLVDVVHDGVLEVRRRAAFAHSVHRRLHEISSSFASANSDRLKMERWKQEWDRGCEAEVVYFHELLEKMASGTLREQTASDLLRGLTFWQRRLPLLRADEVALVEKAVEMVSRRLVAQSSGHAAPTSGTAQRHEEEVSGAPPEVDWLISRKDLSFAEPYAMHTSKRGPSMQLGEWLDTPVVPWKQSQEEFDATKFRRAANVWYSLSHPHIVKLLGGCEIPEGCIFVCEFAEYNSLVQYLHDDGHIDETWRKLHQVALGLQYLHERDVIHGNLNSDSVWIRRDGTVKLGGLCWNTSTRSGGKGRDRRFWSNHDVKWKAPEELATGGILGTASDVYSLGMCIIEAVSGVISWTAELAGHSVEDMVRSGRLPERPPMLLSDSGWGLIESMCCFKPEDRITIQEVVHRIGQFGDLEAWRSKPLGEQPGLHMTTTVSFGSELSRTRRHDWAESPGEVKALIADNDVAHGENADATAMNDEDKPPQPRLRTGGIGVSSGGRGDDGEGDDSDSDRDVAAGGGGDGGGRVKSDPKWLIPLHETWTDEFEPCGATPFISRRLGTWLDAVVAMEKVREPFYSIGQSFESVADRWSQLKHPNVLHLYGACHVTTPPFFVCEYAECGTLSMYLHTQGHQSEVWRTLLDVARGLYYLHRRHVIHGNLKCQNILVGRDGKSRVSGFEFSSTTRDLKSLTLGTTFRGVRWTAPECLDGGASSFASDVYSLGMCVIEAVTGELPWGNNRPDVSVRFLVAEQRQLPAKPTAFSDSQWDLVTRMCCSDADSRLTMAEVVHQIRRFVAVYAAIAQVTALHGTFGYSTSEMMLQTMVLEELASVEALHAKDESMSAFESDYSDSEGEDVSCYQQTVEDLADIAAEKVFENGCPTSVAARRLGESKFPSVFVEAQLRDPTLPEWYIDPSDVIVGSETNRGAFGQVYHGTWLGMPVAIKKAFVKRDQDGAMFLNEVDVWYPLNHPHIVNLFGAYHGDKPFFVCDFAGHGQLDHYLQQPGNGHKVWELLYQTGSALAYLHSRGVVHADLKCSNILVSSEGKAKLTDFGLSFVLKSARPAPTGGAVRWKAPEVLKGESESPQSDIYSFGMCIVEAVSGEYPWGNQLDDTAVKFCVAESKLPNRPPMFSHTQWRLVKRMCCFEPTERLEICLVVQALEIFAGRRSLDYDRLFT